MVENCYNLKNLQKYRNKPFIYQRISENNEQIYNYDDIVQEVSKCIEYFGQNQVENHVGIAVNLQEHSAISCIFLLSILNHNCHFYCLDFNEIQDVGETLRLSNVKYVISKELLESEQTLFKNICEITILNEKYYVLEVKSYNKSFTSLRLCYTIATSGRTGQPKMVHVPYGCIEANIKALSTLLKLHDKDVIFLGSPPTFDPFVIELFLALENGAAVLITTKEIRLKPEYLLKILFPNNSSSKGVTLLQTTPGLLRLFGKENIHDLILNVNSSLRHLILGGEEFPSFAELKSWLPLQFSLSGKRIFNIYGITEVSCWSTIHELDPNKNLEYNRFPLGKPLDDCTLLRITDEDDKDLPDSCGKGQLLIGSSKRRCFIPHSDNASNMLETNDLVYRKTGDLVERDHFGNIYYIGRINNTIKRLGKRLCLDSLAKKLENLLDLLNTKNLSAKIVCLWHTESSKLIFYINYHNSNESEEKETILHLIKLNLEKYEQPDEIYYNNDELPLNNHGKIDRKRLLENILALKENEKKTAMDIFTSFLENVMGLKYLNHYAPQQTQSKKRLKNDLNISFINSGGSSFQALSLAAEIADTLENPAEQRNILEMLLDTNVTIEHILEFLSLSKHKRETKEITFEKPMKFSKNFKLLWRCDFKKCIDASPTIYQENVTVGSHSHLLKSLDAKTGNEISGLELPDRIECSVAYYSSDLALVGCYDGFLYGFNFENGSIVFKIDVKGMIKAKPLVVNNMVIVGSYGEEFNVMAFDIKSFTCLWSLKLGTKGIFASPLKLSEELMLVCSLDGTYSIIEINTGCLKWLKKVESPIFSTPAKIQMSEMLLVVAEVKGQITICKQENGEKITSYQANGNIFSGLTLHQLTSNEALIVFGCHDKNLYCLKFENTNQSLTLSWKFLSNSAIYSTPILISTGHILACSTKGLIVLLDLETSQRKASYDLKAEIFSTPCSLGDKYVYVGARDNFLYAFELK